MKYLVTIDKSYYPEVQYADTEAEAFATRDAIIKEQTDHLLQDHPCNVSVALVLETTKIFTY